MIRTPNFSYSKNKECSSDKYHGYVIYHNRIMLLMNTYLRTFTLPSRLPPLPLGFIFLFRLFKLPSHLSLVLIPIPSHLFLYLKCYILNFAPWISWRSEIYLVKILYQYGTADYKACSGQKWPLSKQLRKIAFWNWLFKML